MLNLLKIAVPTTENKVRHIEILKQLTLIIQGGQSPRVGDSQPPRVARAASTSNNTTAPRVVRATKQIHQRVTRSNTPMPTIMEVEEPPVEESEEQKRQRLVSQPIPLPPPQRQTKARKMDGMWIGSKRNNVKVASRKRITKLINA
jgi:hypothetical protein